MATNKRFPENDPRHHTANIRQMLNDVMRVDCIQRLAREWKPKAEVCPHISLCR